MIPGYPLTQIPAQTAVSANKGLVANQWYFYLQQERNILEYIIQNGPFVQAGSGGGGSTTIFSGTYAERGVPGHNGDVYFTTDTGQIFIGEGGVWLQEVPAYSGDASSQIGQTVLTLATVNPVTYGTFTNPGVITVNEKGLITFISNGPPPAGSVGIPGTIQYADPTPGSFDGDSGNLFFSEMPVPTINLGATYGEGTITLGSGGVIIDGDSSGDLTLTVPGTLTSTVTGNTIVNSTGYISNTGSNITNTSGDAITNIASGNISSSGVSVYTTASGEISSTATLDISLTAGTTITSTAGGNISTTSTSGSIASTAGTSITSTAGTSITSTAGTSITSTAGTSITSTAETTNTLVGPTGITLQTGSTSAGFEINSIGAFGINPSSPDYGTIREVFTSQGSTNPPQWLPIAFFAGDVDLLGGDFNDTVVVLDLGTMGLGNSLSQVVSDVQLDMGPCSYDNLAPGRNVTFTPDPNTPGVWDINANPAPPLYAIQYNDPLGYFGGTSNFEFNPTTNTLTADGTATNLTYDANTGVFEIVGGTYTWEYQNSTGTQTISGGTYEYSYDNATGVLEITGNSNTLEYQSSIAELSIVGPINSSIYNPGTVSLSYITNTGGVLHITGPTYVGGSTVNFLDYNNYNGKMVVSNQNDSGTLVTNIYGGQINVIWSVGSPGSGAISQVSVIAPSYGPAAYPNGGFVVGIGTGGLSFFTESSTLYWGLLGTSNDTINLPLGIFSPLGDIIVNSSMDVGISAGTSNTLTLSAGVGGTYPSTFTIDGTSGYIGATLNTPGGFYVGTGSYANTTFGVIPSGDNYCEISLSGSTGTTGQIITSTVSGALWQTPDFITSVSAAGTYGAALTITTFSGGVVQIAPNVFTSTEPGVVPLSGGGTTNYLRADGSWAPTVNPSTRVLPITPTSSGTDSIPGGYTTTYLMLNPGSNITSYTVDLPSITINGQLVKISNTGGTGSHTIAMGLNSSGAGIYGFGNGATVYFTLQPNTGIGFVGDTTTGSWYLTS